MEILVEIKNVYGQDKIYPLCEKAKIFAKMVGQQTLTNLDVKNIKELGYTVNVLQKQPITL